jgi:tRNA dimethylallyltransferase
MSLLLSIIGPTASGKTQLAVQTALALDGEVISADSRQVYRGMDLGTGKDLADYTVDGRTIPYHLIDIR